MQLITQVRRKDGAPSRLHYGQGCFGGRPDRSRAQGSNNARVRLPACPSPIRLSIHSFIVSECVRSIVWASRTQHFATSSLCATKGTISRNDCAAHLSCADNRSHTYASPQHCMYALCRHCTPMGTNGVRLKSKEVPRKVESIIVATVSVVWQRVSRLKHAESMGVLA